MESKAYDIVLLPEQKLIEQAIQMSDKLQALDSYFTLDNETFFPHVSLYMLQLTLEGLDKAINSLSEIASETKIIKALPNHYHYEYDYIDIEYKKSKELDTLQATIINKINPFRDGLREKDKARLLDAVGKEKENIREYGYRSIGDLFSPHLTFTRFKENQESIIESLPKVDSFEGKLTELGIFEMGDNGTCIRKVKSWQLSA